MLSVSPSEMPPFGMGRGDISVLLVDDEPDLLELTVGFLERELTAVETTTCTDPTEALGLLRTGAYDCVVSDYEMPGLTGLELLDAIQEADLEVPFILFTGKGSEEIASQAISAGVDEYLQKGGTEKYAVLANKIETLVKKHRAESQVQRAFLAIESAQEGIGIIDADGVYQYMNEAYAAVYNRERSELVGRHWDVLYSAEETERFYEDILPELEATGSWRGVSTGITKEGREVPERLVLTQMADGGHVCIVQDLTEEDEMKAELALKDRALDSLPFGLAILDATAEGVPFVYVNTGFEELTGYEADALVGATWERLEGEADGGTVAELERAVRTGETVARSVAVATADGTSVDTVLDLSPVTNETGTVVNVVAVLRRRGSKSVAAEASLDWLSGLAGVLSHDLKTPLTVARGNAELAQDLDDTSRLDPVHSALDRLEALIDDLSNVMAQGSLVEEPRPVDLAAAFRSWGDLEDGSSIEVVDTRRVLADERALDRLADNLVKNSLEHGGEGVRMRVGTLPDGFYFEDTGAGIPAAERDRVFKPGVSSKSNGTGLGLVSIRQIATAHGWSVTVTESAEGGARFEFTGVREPSE
ncbi:response regulator [Natronomonas sp. EA1]|uniref:PAS domain-containing sensor histidine kinase n=1 Tax=Natronomonas sp. EA1 TaxID=3421655 RepID=UPI003EBECE09